jgi:excisionase family DNA binding protein
MEDLINPKEASKMLSVSPDCLRHWENEGKLKAVRTLGGHRRYRLEDIKNIMSGNDQQKTPTADKQ